MRALPALALVLAGLAPSVLHAQQQAETPPAGFPATPILTVDQDRLFEDSAFGARVTAELERASAALAAENRSIEASLGAEERELTERRAALTPEEFRELADAFDARVQQIRREQEEKSRALSQFRDRERQRFFELALPVLAQIVVEAGAVAVLEARTIFLAIDQIDITERAVERIDAAIGEGRQEDPPAATTGEPEAPPPSAPAPGGGPPLDLSDPGIAQ